MVAEKLFECILNESDNKYKAKVAGKGWLKGNGFIDKEDDADTFESKTEPTQRINQMKKDGKLSKNANISIKALKEISSNGFLACCYDPEDYYQETNYVDKDGELHCNSSGCEVFATVEEAEDWADDNRPYGWVSFAMPAGCGPSLKESIETYADIINLKYDLIDEYRDVWGDNTADKMEDVVIKTGDTHGKGLAASGVFKNGKIGIIISPICAAFADEDIHNIVLHELAHCAVYFAFGSFLKDENGGHTKEWHYYVDQLNKKGFDIREVVDDEYLDEIEDRMEKMEENIDDFPKNTRAMYRFAKRKHDDTKAVRKASKEPYWVHPEGVAKIVMEIGGNNTEVKAALAHDVLEDTGATYEDIEEKFGKDIADIVKEVTNDNFKIKKIGKENYISEKLVNLSPSALTVKLADMLYNIKDYPTNENYNRIRNNITFLMLNRDLSKVHCELCEKILDV